MSNNIKMKLNYIIVGYYTDNTGYVEESKKLEYSLKKLNLPYELVSIRNQGSWQANTQYKPYFIQQMLNRHFPKDILYIDVDAIVHQHPLLFDHVDFDLGVVFLDQNEILSGTLYLSNNPKIMELVQRWNDSCLENPEVWDQRVLQHLLQQKNDLNLKVNQLPYTYCKIFDLMAEVNNPVIEHFQASRRFKHTV